MLMLFYGLHLGLMNPEEARLYFRLAAGRAASGKFEGGGGVGAIEFESHLLSILKIEVF